MGGVKYNPWKSLIISETKELQRQYSHWCTLLSCFLEQLVEHRPPKSLSLSDPQKLEGGFMGTGTGACSVLRFVGSVMYAPPAVELHTGFKHVFVC